MPAPLGENSASNEGRYNASMIEITHRRRFLCTCTTLVFIALAGCDRAAPPPSTTGPAPDSATKPAPEPLSSPASQSRPIPTTIATPSPTKPAPAPEPVKSSEPVTTGEPDIKNLPDRTQRLIRDTRKALADAPGSGDLPTRLGMIYLTNDLQRESIPLFRQAIERVPGQAANWYYLGIALAETNDAAGAIAAFQKAVEIDKSLLFAHLRLAELLVAADKPAALAAFQEVERLKPAAAETLTRLARGFDQVGKPEEALAAARKAVELEPRCPFGHEILADLLIKKGDEAAAATHRKIGGGTGVCNTPPDMLYINARAMGHPTRAGIMRAMALANLGNADAAIRSLKQMARDDPMNLDIPLALGQVYQMQGNLTEALGEFGQILRAEPGHLQAAQYLARLQIGVERFADAEKTLTKSLSHHVDHPDLLLLLGTVQARTKRVDEGKETLRRAIELKKGDPAARLEMARVLHRIGQSSEAMTELEALTSTPLAAKVLITRSAIKDSQGDRKGAEDDLRAAQNADPMDPEPFTALGVLFASSKQYDRAIAALEDGYKQHPNDPAIGNALAWLLATAPQESLRNGRRAVEIATKVCDTTRQTIHGYLDTLAAAFAETGDFQSAQRALGQAIDLARRMEDKAVVSEYTARLNQYASAKPHRMQ